MPDNTHYLTPEGMEKLKAELQHLKVHRRKEIANQIAEARAQGDISENAEYDAAREEQGKLEMKISKLENTIANARLADTSQMDSGKIHVLSAVKLLDIAKKTELTYTLVSESEANLKEHKISVESPIGKGLLGKKTGDKVEIQIPAGRIKFKILKVYQR